MLIVMGQGFIIGGGIIAGSGARKKGSEEVKTSDKKLFLSTVENKLYHKK